MSDLPEFIPKKISQKMLDAVWSELTQGHNVIVFFLEAEDYSQVVACAKPLFDWLRPCGVLEESPDVLRLQNNSYLFAKKVCPAAAGYINKSMKVIRI